MAGDKQNFNATIDYTKKMLSICMNEDEISNEFLGMQLNGHLNNLKSANIQKRIEALRYIVSVVDRTKKETKKLGALTAWLRTEGTGGDEEEKPDPPVDPKYLSQWVTEHKILDLVFDLNGLHPEILKQGTHVAQFMKQQGSFDNRYISVLWGASVGKHESDRHALYSFIMDLSKLFSLEDVQHVQGLISQLKLNQLDGEDLSFLYSFSSFAISNFSVSFPSPKTFFDIFYQVKN